jgi:hypothetical protein
MLLANNILLIGFRKFINLYISFFFYVISFAVLITQLEVDHLFH